VKGVDKKLKYFNIGA